MELFRGQVGGVIKAWIEFYLSVKNVENEIIS